MPDEVRGYRTLPYAAAQRQGVDWNEVMSRGHTIHGLVEFDVTETRKAVHEERRRLGAPVSFTALMVASFARAVAADTSVQGFRQGGGKLVLFDDVDCTVLVEHEMDGMLVPMPHIVRNAHRKKPGEIEAEIRAARAEAHPYARAMRFAPLWFRLPGFIRRFTIRRFLANPHRRRRYTGTCAVTAVSMFGRGAGWGIPFISHSIVLTVGGIGRRPGLAPDGHVAPRELVCATLSVDHDVVNGAPLARFISRLRELVESGGALHEGTTAGREPAREPAGGPDA